MRKLLIIALLVLSLSSCSESKISYVVHFENGDAINVGYCLLASQSTSWGEPIFSCDGTVYGNVNYVEKVVEK